MNVFCAIAVEQGNWWTRSLLWTDVDGGTRC
jgi:hypothetical protein